MTRRSVWIVEGWYRNQRGQRGLESWHPTVGIGFRRVDGLKELRRWKARNPDDRFRLVAYQRVKP